MFATTRWSQVVAANRVTAPGRDALESLCRAYWPPLYAYARKHGCDREAAADRVQGFFVELLESPLLARADASRGRFRAYLVTAFRRYLLDESAKARAAKRGGSAPVVAIDLEAAESRCAAVISSQTTPDAVFERGFALVVLDLALERLRDEYHGRGDDAVFTALRPLLVATESGAIARAAESMGASEGAMRVALHRLRSRYRAALRAVVLDTVAVGEDVEEELRVLRETLVG